MVWGLGLGIDLTSPWGPSGKDLSAFDFYDSFNRAAAVLNGQTAEKGGNWATTGTGALDLKTVGTGPGAGAQMISAANVAYAYNASALPAAPAWMTAQWTFKTSIDVPICTAFLTNNSFTSGKALHAATSLLTGNTFWNMTLLDVPTSTFLSPAFGVNSAGYVLKANELYTTDMVYQGMFTKITLSDHTGVVVMSQLIYDPDMSNYVGLYFFFEHLNTASALTGVIGVRRNLPVGWTWPTLNVVSPNGTTGWSLITGFVNSPFGGSATQGSGKCTIAGTTFGAGGVTPLGALTTSDKVAYSIDVSNFVGATDARFYVTMTDGSGATANIVTHTSSGLNVPGTQRFSGILQPTNNNSQSLLICATNYVGNPTFSCDISTKFLMLENPPTTP